LKVLACKAYLGGHCMYTALQIATLPLPKKATLKMHWYRFWLKLFWHPFSMPCDHSGCTRMSEWTSSEWLNKDAMVVKYWCVEHAPLDAEFFEV
jgi:hypothetical protein